MYAGTNTASVLVYHYAQLSLQVAAVGFDPVATSLVDTHIVCWCQAVGASLLIFCFRGGEWNTVNLAGVQL